MKILLLDNYDSFTFNLYHYLSSLKCKVDVVRNDKINSREILNKKYKSGISSSIKVGLKKISKKNKGFVVVQSDMPFIKSSDINKICNSIKKRKFLVHALKFKNKMEPFKIVVFIIFR